MTRRIAAAALASIIAGSGLATTSYAHQSFRICVEVPTANGSIRQCLFDYLSGE